jgi:hypothetical protein
MTARFFAGSLGWRIGAVLKRSDVGGDGGDQENEHGYLRGHRACAYGQGARSSNFMHLWHVRAKQHGMQMCVLKMVVAVGVRKRSNRMLCDSI